MSDLRLKTLLEAGAHFGHQTHKWNPKMKKYVYGERNGVYIIDVAKTVQLAKSAYEFVRNISASGKSVLFVGTKRQASGVVSQCAKDCGAFFVSNRWLGGMLTNHKTISLSIDKIRKVEKMKENGDFFLLTKREQGRIEKNIAKLEKNLGGIKNMKRLPGAIFVVDPQVEEIAVKEANSLGIPVVAVIDTNCDPTGVDYVIPANDDAIKSITLFAEYMAKAVSEGQSQGQGRSGDGDKSEGTPRDYALEEEILSKFEEDIDLLGEESEETSSEAEEV